MDLTDVYTIKSILRENRIRPNKSFGQNFLVDHRSLDKLIESAQIKTDDIVVEIGPGLGTITEELAKHAKLVLAIEKDYDFVTLLRKQFKHYKNVKIVHEDILQFPMSNFQFPMTNQCQNSNVKNDTKKFTPSRKEVSSAGLTETKKLKSYKLVSALPYNITSPVIRKFLQDSNKPYAISHKPEMMVLMVQKEVAERICAKPGNSERGFLTVLVEFFADAKIIENVDRSCFWPSPKVDSAIIKIEVRSKKTEASEENINTEPFFRLVKAGFSQKRRQIHNPLKANLHLSKDDIFAILKKAGVDEKKRAEELTMEEWINLYKTLSSKL